MSKLSIRDHYVLAVFLSAFAAIGICHSDALGKTTERKVSASVMTGNIRSMAKGDCDYQLEKRAKKACRKRPVEIVGETTYAFSKRKGDNWAQCSRRVRCLSEVEVEVKRAEVARKQRPKAMARKTNALLETLLALFLASFVVLPMAVRGWVDYRLSRTEGMSSARLVFGPGIDLGVSAIGLIIAFANPTWFPFFAILVLPLTPAGTLSGMPIIGGFFANAEAYIDLLKENPDQATKLFAESSFREEEAELLRSLVLGAASVGLLQAGVIVVSNAVTAAGNADWVLPVVWTVIGTVVGLFIVRTMLSYFMEHIGVFLIGIPLWIGFRISVALENLREQS